MRQLWQRYLSWRRRNVAELALADAGFRLRHGSHSASVGWAQIERIVAYKRDLFTYDLLCLLIQTTAGIVEIHEDMEGYATVEAAMADALQLGSEWKLAVLFPAFAGNPTTIFAREDSR
ncbi:MAG: hypothetical protein ABW203_02360 [Novosphingobium sp.]